MQFAILVSQVKPCPLYHYAKSGSKNVVIDSDLIQDQTFV